MFWRSLVIAALGVLFKCHQEFSRMLHNRGKKKYTHNKEKQWAVYDSSMTFQAFLMLSLAGQHGGKNKRTEAKMKEGELIKPNRRASDLHVQ